jgi:hypothetical protein
MAHLQPGSRNSQRQRRRSPRYEASLLSDLGLFGAGSPVNASFEIFLKKRACLKLNDLPNDEVKTALAEILIVQLHGHALRGDQPRRLTRLMVFDEAHRVKDSKRLEQLAREGRAFGVGIVPETMAHSVVLDEQPSWPSPPRCYPAARDDLDQRGEGLARQARPAQAAARTVYQCAP